MSTYFSQSDGAVFRHRKGKVPSIWLNAAWHDSAAYNPYDTAGISLEEVQQHIGEGNDLHGQTVQEQGRGDRPDPAYQQIEGSGSSEAEQAGNELADQFDQARRDAEEHGGSVVVPQDIDLSMVPIHYADAGPNGEQIGSAPPGEELTPGWEERVKAALDKVLGEESGDPSGPTTKGDGEGEG